MRFFDFSVLKWVPFTRRVMAIFPLFLSKNAAGFSRFMVSIKENQELFRFTSM